MGLPLQGSRSGCALHGALHAALAIEGIVPVIHATTGCGIQSHLGGTLAGGYSGSGSVGGGALSSSNICEKQVVFGGTSRLREQIKNTVKLISGELYVVLSGCAAEMVGDDIPAMAKEAREQGFQVISISTPGFRGSAYRGYELFLKGVISQHEILADTSARKIPGLINILGIVPIQDPYWEGDLDEVADLLAGVGLRANTLFGHNGGIEGLRSLNRAQLSLVFSPWGLEAARELESRFGIPWISISFLPVGAEESAKLLETLAGALLLNLDTVNNQIDGLRQREEHFLKKLADAYYIHGWQREFALIADSSIAPGIATFLTTTLGLLPSLVVITDNPADHSRHDLAGTLDKLLPGFDTRVLFSEDRGEISDALLQRPPEIILGSSLEKKIAQRLNIPLVEVSFPVSGQLLLDKRHAGPCGALTLLEDLGREIVAHQHGVMP